MADEQLLLELQIGGNSEEAKSAVLEAAQSLDQLQTSLDNINGTNVQAAGDAASQASNDMSNLSGVAGDTAGSLQETESSATSAEGSFKSLTGTAGELSGKLGEGNSSLGEMTGLLTEVGGGIGEMLSGPGGIAALGVVGVGAFTSLGSKAGEWANEMLRLQSVTGMSTEETEKWKVAMEIAGGEASSLQRFSIRLSGALDDLSKGSTGPAALALNQLGVNATDSEGKLRGFGEVFPELLQKLGAMDDKTQAAALAGDIFGKRAIAPLIPLINNYSQIMGNAEDITGKYGEGIDNAEQYAIELNTAQTRLNEQFEQFYTEVGPPFLSMMIAIGDAVDTVTTAVGTVNEGLGYMGTGLGKLITTMTPWSTAVNSAALASDLWHGNLKAVPDDLRSIAEGLPIMGMAVQGTEAVVTGAVNAVGDTFGGIFGHGGKTEQAVNTSVEKLREFRDVDKETTDGLIAHWTDFADTAAGQLRGFRDAESSFSAESTKAWEDFKTATSGYLEEHKTAIKSVFPTLDEQFDQWSKRLAEEAVDYANFQTNLQTILDALVQAHVKEPQAIIQALSEAGPEVTAAMAENLAQGGVDAVSETLGNLATITNTNTQAMTDAVIKNTPDFKEAGRNLGGAGVQGASEGIAGMAGVGEDAVAGIVAGMQANHWRLIDEAGAMGALVPSTVRGVLDSRSPSLVMMEVGKDAVEGLSLGFQQEASTAGNEMGNAIRALISGNGQALSDALNDLSDYLFGKGQVAGGALLDGISTTTTGSGGTTKGSGGSPSSSGAKGAIVQTSQLLNLGQLVEVAALLGTTKENIGGLNPITVARYFNAQFDSVAEVLNALLAINPLHNTKSTLTYDSKRITDLLRPYGLTFAQGGEITVNRPTLAMFGEAGTETARFTPGGRSSGDVVLIGPLIEHHGPLMGNAVEAKRFARQILDLARTEIKGLPT